MLLALCGAYVQPGVLLASEPRIQSIGEGEGRMRDSAASQIEVNIVDPELQAKQDMLLDWIVYSTQTVIHYYGRFPVRSVYVERRGRRRPDGRVSARPSAATRPSSAWSSAKTSRKPCLATGSWCTNSVQLAMADVPRRHRWWLEGIATYVESIARARADESTRTSSGEISSSACRLVCRRPVTAGST